MISNFLLFLVFRSISNYALFFSYIIFYIGFTWSIFDSNLFHKMPFWLQKNQGFFVLKIVYLIIYNKL